MKCKWFPVCPLRSLERRGLIDYSWQEAFCRGNYKSCERYKKEEAGIPHSDTLLPDGTYLQDNR